MKRIIILLCVLSITFCFTISASAEDVTQNTNSAWYKRVTTYSAIIPTYTYHSTTLPTLNRYCIGGSYPSNIYENLIERERLYLSMVHPNFTPPNDYGYYLSLYAFAPLDENILNVDFVYADGYTAYYPRAFVSEGGMDIECSLVCTAPTDATKPNVKLSGSVVFITEDNRYFTYTFDKNYDYGILYDTIYADDWISGISPILAEMYYDNVIGDIEDVKLLNAYTPVHYAYLMCKDKGYGTTTGIKGWVYNDVTMSVSTKPINYGSPFATACVLSSAYTKYSDIGNDVSYYDLNDYSAIHGYMFGELTEYEPDTNWFANSLTGITDEIFLFDMTLAEWLYIIVGITICGYLYRLLLGG